MFIMTSEIQIGSFKSVKPSAVKWKCSVSNFTDTCSISLPLRTYVRNLVVKDSVLQTSMLEANVNKIPDTQQTVFAEGNKVEVYLGYNNKNTLRFKGFIKRINYAKPLVLECEGYSYQLKNKVFTKSYTTTSVKEILSDLIAGTDIKLSEFIPDIPLKNVPFKNCPGLKVLEWFQKECLLAVYFDFEKLYVGSSKYGIKKPTQKLRLGWNTADDNELKKDTVESNVIIHVVEKSSTGTVKRTKSVQKKYSTTKEVKARAGMPDKVLKEVANELQKIENFSGYKGEINCFLEPHFENGYVAKIIDNMFPDRNGSYFVESVDGSFDSSGGRQKITLRYYGNVDGK